MKMNTEWQWMRVLETRRKCLAAPKAINALVGMLHLRKPVGFPHRLSPLRMTSLMLVCMFFGFAGSAWLIAQNSAPAKQVSPLEQSFIANEKSLIDAKKKDDGAFFKRTVTSDFAFVGVDGQLLQGQEAIDNLGDSALVELTPYNIKVVPATGDSVIITYDAVVREAPQEDQGPPPRYQHFSSVWVKQGDAWKLKFQQTTATHWGDW
jgi:hypothetical protein